jgi:glycosyltransferase involved in cell wall biosynthesis
VLTINVYAENYGWLFEDLKQHFRSLSRKHGFEVLVSDQPVPSADAWVALRTKEGGASPDIGRTVICIHDLFCEPGMYQAGGQRQCVRQAGALALSHPEQRSILSREEISLQNVPILERPLGALSIFTPRQLGSQRFCVGWVGRNHARKRLDWFVEAILGLNLQAEQLAVTLMGAGLEDAARTLQTRGVDCRHYDKQTHDISQYPQLYQSLDCLVITSSTEAGPLPLFEALATGLAVVSTPVGWSPYFSKKAPRYVRLACSPSEITARLQQFKCEKEEIFNRRLEIASLVQRWSLDGWLLAVLNLAASLIAGSLTVPQKSGMRSRYNSLD